MGGNAVSEAFQEGTTLCVIPVPGGITHLPDVFRQVAKSANVSGLNGFELIDVECCLDVEATKRYLADPTCDRRGPMPACVRLTYRRDDQS
jgi:hypothetical protein